MLLYRHDVTTSDDDDDALFDLFVSFYVFGFCFFSSLLINIICVFFLDVYGFNFTKPIRAIINDGVYRVSLVASSPSRFIPQATGSLSDLLSLKKENERLKKELEIFKQKELNVEFLSNQNKNLKKQLQYADRKKLNLAIICGENEFKDKKLTIKKLNSSKENDQLVINRKDLVNEISKLQ